MQIATVTTMLGPVRTPWIALFVSGGQIRSVLHAKRWVRRHRWLQASSVSVCWLVQVRLAAIRLTCSILPGRLHDLLTRRRPLRKPSLQVRPDASQVADAVT